MADVVLEDVSCTFAGEVAAVRELSLVIEDREFMVLLGPSGCGKSTTLRLIAGLEDPTSGHIRIGGRIVDRLPPKDRDVAMVFQNYALYPHMSVYRNMAFGLELRYGGGLVSRVLRRIFRPQEARRLAELRATIDERVRRVADMLGIGQLLQRRPRELSGGERQRVAVGRALVREPAVYLFDEPLSNVDAKLRVGMRRELKQLHRRLATTMIFVTHDQVEAMTLGDRIAVMHQGQLQQVGTPQEVYDWPQNRFVASFLGTPPMSFLVGKLVDEGDAVSFSGSGGSVAVDKQRALAVQRRIGQPLVMGIRPEDVRVREADTGPAGLRGQIAVVEPIGDAQILHLDLMMGADGADGPTAGSLLCKTTSRANYVAGAVVTIELDTRRAHFFDPATGENLVRGRGDEGS